MHLRIGCRLTFRCDVHLPLLALVHPHSSLKPQLGPEQQQVLPEVAYELLRDPAGNRLWRLRALPGETRLHYAATIRCSDATDPVHAALPACPVEALPADTYRFLNASTYCDTAALMHLAWSTFAGVPRGWPLVQAICDWVHSRLRFDGRAVHPHKRASDALAEGAGVCRDYAHLAISLCRCLNIPARYCTGYLGYTGIPQGAAPVDFSAWFEAFLCDRWHVFDARHTIPRSGRVLIARGRDAADVPFLRSFGAHQLTGLEVISEAISPEPARRSPSENQGDGDPAGRNDLEISRSEVDPASGDGHRSLRADALVI